MLESSVKLNISLKWHKHCALSLSNIFLLKTLTIVSFFFSSSFCSDYGSYFDDASEHTEKESHFPEDYTLMLLDRSRTDWESITCTTREEELRVFTVSQNKVEGFSYRLYSAPYEYCVYKLVRNQYKRAAEKLIDSLLPSDQEISIAEEPRTGVFSAAMILFPVEDDLDKVLAYLFGRWLGIINVDTIVKNFGLHAATSVGVFCSEKDRTNLELANIHQINSEERRQDKPMVARKRSRGDLYPIRDFKLEAGDSKVDELRFRPISEWGRAYITANDAFKFRLNNPTDLIQTLRDKAFKLYEVFKSFSEQTVYAPFQDYIDIPICGDLADELYSNPLGQDH